MRRMWRSTFASKGGRSAVRIASMAASTERAMRPGLDHLQQIILAAGAQYIEACLALELVNLTSQEAPSFPSVAAHCLEHLLDAFQWRQVLAYLGDWKSYPAFCPLHS